MTDYQILELPDLGYLVLARHGHRDYTMAWVRLGWYETEDEARRAVARDAMVGRENATLLYSGDGADVLGTA